MMLRACGLLLGCVFALVALPAVAQEPTTTQTPAAAPTNISMTLRDDGVGQYSWDAVPGAASYQLHVELAVVRGSATNPFCEPPLEADTRTFTVDETLPATQLSYTIVLPELPPEDRWYQQREAIDLSASDAAGTQIAGIARQGVTETICPRQALAEPLTFSGCTIPAGWYEVTTPAATERGQRVFEAPDQSSRYYVYAAGNCVHLVGPIDPIPEFAPDPIVVPDEGVSVLRPPNTGTGMPHPQEPMTAVPLIGILATGLAMLAMGLRERRSRSSPPS